MTQEELKALKIAACQVRMGTIEAVYGAKAGHPGGSLSSAEVFAYLYNKEMKIDPANPNWEGRDRFVLSKGHTAPGLYAALAYRGFFPVEDLPTFRHIDSYLQGHPSMTKVPGVDMSTGSLGQGVSTACGMALGFKRQGMPNRVYALLGDGELEEGQVWEALMFAAHYKLDNLCIVIDNNGLQIDGSVADVMSSYPIDEKVKAFNWHLIDLPNGHDLEALEAAFNEARATKGQPTCILMHTTKGKDVSYMENSIGWHGKAPNEEEYNQAMSELRDIMDKIEKGER